MDSRRVHVHDNLSWDAMIEWMLLCYMHGMSRCA